MSCSPGAGELDFHELSLLVKKGVPPSTIWRQRPHIWRVSPMGAILAQFTTPFSIKDTSLKSYSQTAFLRLPRDRMYQSPSPERPRRGWIVMRQRSGSELFRADVNLFMDGGVGVALEDSARLGDLLIRATAPVLSVEQSAQVLDAILGRLEGLNSPWGEVSFDYAANGIECFHEDVEGKQTSQHFLVDVRLERLVGFTAYR